MARINKNKVTKCTRLAASAYGRVAFTEKATISMVVNEMTANHFHADLIARGGNAALVNAVVIRADGMKINEVWTAPERPLGSL